VSSQGHSAAEEIELLIKAKYPLIYIVSHEDKRVLKVLQQVATATKTVLHSWSVSRGITDANGKPVGEGTNDPEFALDHVLTSKVNGLFAFLDFHHYITPHNPDRMAASRFIRKIRDIAAALPSSSHYKSLVFVSPVCEIPLELEKEVAVIDFPLPGLPELEEMFAELERSIKSRDDFSIDLSPSDREELLKAALGLTLGEAENAFAKALIEDLALTAKGIERILREKERLIKKTGMLEYIAPDQSMSTVGGLDALKQWLGERASGFSEKARGFPLPPPRGVLLIGVPGCGKSLCAKVVACEWKKPLLRFDVGRAFGKYVGESESNMRKAIKIAESLAPCVLWIDEIEKEFGGTSGEGDSGTSARVFASFLTWMQEKDSPVFVMATANNIHRLPPEFLRKGRFDEIFFVDLPFEDERKEIFRIHLARRKRNPGSFDLDLLSKESDGYSGAEIEEAIISALYRVFNGGRELTTEDILQSLKETHPLSEVMKERIQEMRSWAKDRARYASCKGRTETGELVDRWQHIGGSHA